MNLHTSTVGINPGAGAPANEQNAPPAEQRGVSRARSDPNLTYAVRVLGQRQPLIVSGGKYHKVAAIAVAQRGRVSTKQLTQAGITKAMVRTMVRQYHLLRLHHGVYAVGHRAPLEWGDETAALLAGGDTAVLSHHTAARLWGMRLDQSLDSLIHVTATVHRAQPAGVVVHRSGTLLPRDVAVRRGLPVTTAARALLDIAPGVTERELELALDDALRRRITTVAQVRDVLARASRRPGAKALDDLLDREGPPTVTRSQAEEMLLALVRRARLPEPELNARLLGYEVDALWRRERLVVEVDGYEYHRSRVAFEADRAKGAALTAAGYPVLRLTVRQMRDRPLRVVVQVAQALARR